MFEATIRNAPLAAMDPDVPVIVAAGVGLLAFAAIAGVVLFAVFGAVSRKRWGVAAAIPLGLLLVGLTLVAWQSAVRVPQPVPSQTNQISYEINEPKFRPTASLTTRAIKDAAAAKPKIDLDVVAEVASDAELIDVVAATGRQTVLPVWMDDPGVGREVLTVGPYATVESCRENACQQVIDWVWSETGVSQPDLGAEAPAWWTDAVDEIVKRCVVERFIEKREVSVGDVYFQHTLVGLDSADRGWLEERVATWRSKATRDQGVRGVAIGGAVVVGLVGWCHLMLRKPGPAKPPE